MLNSGKRSKHLTPLCRFQSLQTELPGGSDIILLETHAILVPYHYHMLNIYRGVQLVSSFYAVASASRSRYACS